jgi:hypothetical protein
MVKGDILFKICKQCNLEKPLEEFPKRKDSKDGHYYYCKECNYARVKKWNEENPDKKKLQSRKWKKENSDKVKALSVVYYQENKENLDIKKKQWKENNKEYLSQKRKEDYAANKEIELARQKEYRKNNRIKLNAKAAYERAAKGQATPKWLTKDHKTFIEIQYQMAKLLEDRMGVKYHVDHIHPLQNESICGLHVPWNLRVIPAVDNIRKGNKLIGGDLGK